MKSKWTTRLPGIWLCLIAANALAGDAAALIELDRNWGNATLAGDSDAVAALLSDDLVSVDGSGVGGKDRELANSVDAPEGATYEPADYTVMFLDDHTAVMTHSVHGNMPHYSMHVWSNAGGSWQVVASSSTPMDSDE